MDSENKCSERTTNHGKHDPGWNDPPTFSYNTQTPVKPRLSLNKRVAFPLNSAPPSSNVLSNIPTQLPPILPNSVPIPPQVFPTNLPCTTETVSILNPTATDILNSQCSVSKDNLESGNEMCDVNEVVDILENILENNQELGNKIEDIQRRINIMKNMWNEGKLANSIQVSMLKLVKALQESDTKTADDLHKSLMVDHISSVSSWMVAIKQLIFHCNAKNELLKIDEDSAT